MSPRREHDFILILEDRFLPIKPPTRIVPDASKLILLPSHELLYTITPLEAYPDMPPKKMLELAVK